MKILYVSNNRFPTEKAHGLQIAKMCEAFLEAGAELQLVVPDRKQTADVNSQSPKEFYGLRREINVRRIYNIDFLQSSFLPRIIAYFIQSISFAISFIYRRKNFKYDVIYSRTILPMLFEKNKWFFEAHTFPKSFFGRLFQQIVLKKSAGIICISDGLRRKYESIYDGKILTAEDGVDLRIFGDKKTMKAVPEKAKGPGVILYTGSPYGWKGVFTLAKATSKMKNIEMIFLGGNHTEPEFLRLKKYAQDAKVLPYVSYLEVPKFIEKADVLVIPNSAKDAISKEDSSPLKLFEYMASGKKIVASDVPAIRSVLSEKEAWFFKPDDADDLRKVLENALSSRNIKGEQAAMKAKNYSWSNRAEKIISFLNS